MTHIESRSTPHIEVVVRWHRLISHSDATSSRFIYLGGSRLFVSFNNAPTARRIRLITYAASFGVSRRTVPNELDLRQYDIIVVVIKIVKFGVMIYVR